MAALLAIGVGVCVAQVQRAGQRGRRAAGGRGRDVQLARVRVPRGDQLALLAQLGQINPALLNRDNQVDYALLKNELEYRVWGNDVSQDWAWNAQIYNDIAAGSLYTLAARDFAPWDVRLKAATARMEALPALLREGRQQLVPARVPKIFAETVSKQNGGILEIAEGMLAPHADQLSSADRARFDAALAGLKVAVAEQQTWLDTVLVPAANELPRQYSAMSRRWPGRAIIEMGRASGAAKVCTRACFLATSSWTSSRSKPLWSLR